MEIYEPPYLFLNVERPIVRVTPERVGYKETFLVTMQTDATKIDKANFIRYSTSTHSTNMDQRLVELLIVQKNRTHLILQAPAHGAIAPPGNYHLFLLREGMPCKAPTIRLRLGEGDQTLRKLENGIAVNAVNTVPPKKDRTRRITDEDDDDDSNNGSALYVSVGLFLVSLFASLF